MSTFSIIRNASFAIMAGIPFWASAQIETRQLAFASGKNSATVRSTINGEQTIDYKINVLKGQELKVTMKTSNTANYFNILPPGSVDVAIYVGSTDGNNSFTGMLDASGEYTIRVYLIRSAARRNEKGKFTITVSATGSANSKSNDALVTGTPYHATGKVRSSFGNEPAGTVMSDFGVIRSSNTSAEVHITYPKTMTRILTFKNGKWTASAARSIKATNKSGVWEVIINDYEHYFIPEEVITGG